MLTLTPSFPLILDFEEFLLLLIYLEEDGGGQTREQVMGWFKMIDIECKGFISLSDLKRVFGSMAAFGGAFLDDLERDPDASVKARAIEWDEFYNRLVMEHAKKICAGDDGKAGEVTLFTGEERITPDDFVKLVEMLDI
jgi:hypothetical protein